MKVLNNVTRMDINTGLGSVHVDRNTFERDV